MPTYTHTRPTKAGGAWASMSTANAGGDILPKLVETDFPGKVFKIRADNGNVHFDFDEALTAGEQTTLSTTVSGFTPV